MLPARLGKRMGYRPGDWLPHGGDMGRLGPSGLGPMAEAVISALSIGQIHGLMNPSYGDLKDRGGTGNLEAIANAREGLKKALLVELGVSGVIGYAFGTWIPSAVGAGVSLLLFWLGSTALDSGYAGRNDVKNTVREVS